MHTHPSPTAPLRSPADSPDSDVVIYDGQCRFCRKQIDTLSRLDGGKRLTFLSLHDSQVYEQYPDLTKEQLLEEMVVVDGKGNRYHGAKAVRFLTRRLPKLWPLAPLTHLTPLPLLRWGYRKIAKHRYRLMGKVEECENGSCKLHFD